MVRAAQILGEALNQAPESFATRPGPDMSPSRLATTLMGLLEREPGAKCEMRRSTFEYAKHVNEAPRALWHRAVWKLADGSVIAVHDGGGEVAKSDQDILRYPNGEFASVVASETAEEYERAMGRLFDRIPGALSSHGADAMDLVQAKRPINTQHPLSKHLPVLAEVEGSLIVATPNGLEVVPGDLEGNQALLKHAQERMESMSKKLGLSQEELLEEMEPNLHLFRAAVAAFKEEQNLTDQEVIDQFVPR